MTEAQTQRGYDPEREERPMRKDDESEEESWYEHMTVTLELPRGSVNDLRELARKRGLTDVAVLVEEWVEEQLDEALAPDPLFAERERP